MRWGVERRDAEEGNHKRHGEASKEVPKHGEVLQDYEDGGRAEES